MKINNTYLVLLLFFFQITLGQTSVSKEIMGQIFEQSTSVEAVNIINNNTQHNTISDANGMFSIKVREGDILVFSAVNLEPLKRRISAEDLKLVSLEIKMSSKEIRLKEVIVNENAAINAENLGIVPRGQKTYTPEERKLYTATTGEGIDGLLNTISGRKAMIKKEIVVQKKEMLFQKIEYLFDEAYYIERLKIPLDDIKGFQLYCINDAKFALSLNAKNKTMSMFLITDLAREYLKIIENEN